MPDKVETGDTRHTVSDPAVSDEAVQPYWTTRHGWVIEPDDATPQGEDLAAAEVGVAAQAARAHLEESLTRLADFTALWAAI
jgi:hypothetical protein